MTLWVLAHALGDGSRDQARWEREVAEACLPRVRTAGVTTPLASYLADEALPEDGSFGRAMVISADGAIIASLAVGRADILEVSL